MAHIINALHPSTHISRDLFSHGPLPPTQALTAEMVTYNAPLRIFGYFFAEFYFSQGGSIKVGLA